MLISRKGKNGFVTSERIDAPELINIISSRLGTAAKRQNVQMEIEESDPDEIHRTLIFGKKRLKLVIRNVEIVGDSAGMSYTITGPRGKVWSDAQRAFLSYAGITKDINGVIT